MKRMFTKFNFWIIPYVFLFMGILGIVAVRFIKNRRKTPELIHGDISR